jgi:hypothetical protein
MRSNAWALVAVAVLGAGAVSYSLAFDWRGYQENNPTQPVDVAPREVGTLGAATFQLTSFRLIEGDSRDGQRYDVPEGTDVVVADLHIVPDPAGDPDEDYAPCDLLLRAPSPEGEREWWKVSNPTTLPEPEGLAFGCNTAGGEPFDLRVYYVVPAGGATDAYLLVTTPEELPRALRLH